MLARRILIFAAVLTACTGLKSADIQPGNNSPDAAAPGTNADGGGDDDDTSGIDASALIPPDAGKPPDDFECEKDEWTKPTKSRAECDTRQVSVVETTATTDTVGISIARTPAGRVGISYNDELALEDGRFHLAHFIPKAPGFTKPEVIIRSSLNYFHDGFRSRLAATAPDTLQILTYDVSDIDLVGTLNETSLVNGKKPLTAPVLIAGGIKGGTEISYAVAPDGTAYALARVSTSDTKAKLITRRKEPSSTWGDLADVPELGYGLLPKEAPAIGASSLFIDPSGQLHLLYHHNESMARSTPRYHLLAGGGWNMRKTVDNNAPDGFAGYNPRVVTFGTRKYALYFYRKVPGDGTADLLLATWVDGLEKPGVEILDSGIAAPDAMYPRHVAAMAVDKYGLLHLAIVAPPSTSPNKAPLEYRRQVRLPAGGTKWLNDIVAPEVLSEQSSAYVDLLVDENARPHIAYRNGADSKVYYATRFDR